MSIQEVSSAKRFDPRALFSLDLQASNGLTELTEFRVSAPFDNLVGVTEWSAVVATPLNLALSDSMWTSAMVLTGRNMAGDLQTAGWGHLEGVLNQAWCGMESNGVRVALRLGFVCDHESNAVSRCTVMIDIVDLAQQLKVPLTPQSLGESGRWPNPQSQGDNGGDAETLSVVKAMQSSLHDSATTREEMLAADHLQFWAEDFVWAGPGGIGITHGKEGFVDHHQLPFRTAFPDRVGGGVSSTTSAGPKFGHFVKFSEGGWAVTGGWPSVAATHKGDGWLGATASKRPITLRVFDFYEVVAGRISMNWVFIDIVDFLRQIDRLPESIKSYSGQQRGIQK